MIVFMHFCISFVCFFISTVCMYFIHCKYFKNAFSFARCASTTQVTTGTGDTSVRTIPCQTLCTSCSASGLSWGLSGRENSRRRTTISTTISSNFCSPHMWETKIDVTVDDHGECFCGIFKIMYSIMSHIPRKSFA